MRIIHDQHSGGEKAEENRTSAETTGEIKRGPGRPRKYAPGGETETTAESLAGESQQKGMSGKYPAGEAKPAGWRAGVDWHEVMRKAWETRRRKLAAAKGGATGETPSLPAPLPQTENSAAPPKQNKIQSERYAGNADEERFDVTNQPAHKARQRKFESAGYERREFELNYCPTCGSDLPGEHGKRLFTLNYCTACGAKLPSME